MRVQLLPTNKRHKQLIREFGDIWHQRGDPEPKLCFNNELGVWITCETPDGERRHGRNVRLTDIEVVNEND